VSDQLALVVETAGLPTDRIGASRVVASSSTQMRHADQRDLVAQYLELAGEPVVDMGGSALPGVEHLG